MRLLNLAALVIACLEFFQWYLSWRVREGPWSSLLFGGSPLSVSTYDLPELRWMTCHGLFTLLWKAPSDCPTFFFDFYIVWAMRACERINWIIVSKALTLVLVGCTTFLVTYILHYFGQDRLSTSISLCTAPLAILMRRMLCKTFLVFVSC